MKAISGQRELETLLKSKTAVVLKFSATWCGPCRAFAPFMDKLDAQFPGVAMYEVDLDANQDIAKQYSVTAVPTVILFKKGKEIGRIQGADTQQAMTQVKRLAESSTTMADYGPGYSLGGSDKKTKGVAIPASRSSHSLLTWIRLYFVTLFSFDARAAAKSYLGA
ncbi:Thioredoxin H-type [Wickerhamiella sorbophila]|uniref:Thioredoxin H-type n=1 Tax=Wickerhamiella sorbophila TaxID=45607 RepID=A0A2T0FFE7_9ASCO|nr:Thioredoxin H-type [Wickerhamiella sorbophila]PRT53723.1 Thioredoxin H-type [Wickerhamiella sorbophila]